MCKYCEDEANIFEWGEIHRGAWYWGTDDIKINLKEAEDQQVNRGVFMDRGHLRLVNLDDCGCMDHGENVKANYCFNCGKKLEG